MRYLLTFKVLLELLLTKCPAINTRTGRLFAFRLSLLDQTESMSHLLGVTMLVVQAPALDTRLEHLRTGLEAIISAHRLTDRLQYCGSIQSSNDCTMPNPFFLCRAFTF